VAVLAFGADTVSNRIPPVPVAVNPVTDGLLPFLNDRKSRKSLHQKMLGVPD